ncbi:hypothetical protein Tco_0377923 [Tanacetum coccineum]
MPTEMELTLEQTQQGVSYEVLNIRVNSFTMKMEILLESTSNKLMIHTSAGNPVKKILLKLNLSDHSFSRVGMSMSGPESQSTRWQLPVGVVIMLVDDTQDAQDHYVKYKFKEQAQTRWQ